MLIKNIVGKDWKVTYDNFSWLLEDNNFQENKDFLGEDILQIEHLHKYYIVDIGWYQSLDLYGKFKIVLIKNENWNSPLLEYSTTDLGEIIQKIYELTNGILIKF